MNQSTFKEYISLPEISETIIATLSTSSLLAEILRNDKWSPYHRYYLAERYPLLVRMVYDPESVDGWMLED